MRGTVGGLGSPYSFGELLPAIYQDDEFAMRWMVALDEVLAPVVSVIDNIERYFQPAYAPGDFVEMLAAWVGVELDETWNDQSRRDLVLEAVSLYRIRGTVAGLKRHVEIYTGVEPEIEESGACAWSLEAGGPLPGEAAPSMVVRVRVADPSTIDEKRLWRLVASSKPAHVGHRVEILPLDGPDAPGSGPAGDADTEPVSSAQEEVAALQSSPIEPEFEDPLLSPTTRLPPIVGDHGPLEGQGEVPEVPPMAYDVAPPPVPPEIITPELPPAAEHETPPDTAGLQGMDP